jgi:two-component SAPR family response regulator
LRNALRKGDNEHRFIFVETGEYWLDSARFRIDVDEFNHAILKARSSMDLSVAIPWYERALELYKGEYLQNLYYEWVFPERRSLAQTYMGALQELVAYYASGPDPQPALRYFEKALSVDNLNEDLYCHAMRAYATLGDRSSLVNLYNKLREHLRLELDSEPLPRTKKFYHEALERINLEDKNRAYTRYRL